MDPKALGFLEAEMEKYFFDGPESEKPKKFLSSRRRA